MDEKFKEALDLLEIILDKYENGEQCYDEPDGNGVFIGCAIRLDDETFDRIVNILNEHRPLRDSI